MILWKSKYFLFFIIGAVLFIHIKGIADTIQPSQNALTIAQLTATSREASEARANDIKANIANLVKAHKYEEAEKEYAQLSAIYDMLGDTQSARLKKSLLQTEKNMFYKKWGDYLEDEASDAFLQRNYNQAKKLSQESITTIRKMTPEVNNDPTSLAPEGIKKVSAASDTSFQNRIIRDSEAAVKNEKFAEETGMNKALPQYQYRVMDLDSYLSQAQIYMQNREYDQARESLEKALVLDPYNYKAMTMLQTLYSKVFAVGKARSTVEAYKYIGQAQWLNNQAVLPNVTTDEADLKVIEADHYKETDLNEKLNTMIVSKIDFEDAAISSVITYLNRESKIADKEGKGINIIMRLSNTQLQPPPVSLQLDNVPIGEIIKYVCFNSGLKYRVEEDAVIIGDSSIDGIETKFFRINSGLINSIVSNINVENKTIGSDDEDFYDTKTMLTSSVVTEMKVSAQDLQLFFIQRGLPFPPGSSIAWDSKTSSIILTNNPENIRLAESLIKELDVNIPLVLIEAKFVEITQTELEELAFKWKIRYEGSKGDAEGGQDDIIRHFNQDQPTQNQYAMINDFAMSNLKNLKVNFWMYAIDQSKTLEVLSAPKVITKSGSEALIKMVTEVYYPEDWTEPEVDVSSSEGSSAQNITYSGPTFSNPTDLGIILYVTPTVSPNNHTILLDLKPQVIDFVGWDDYSYYITQTVDGGTAAETTKINAPVKMAQISRRDVESKVKVYDGETIVLGGTIKEDATYVDDSMPFLSDVPIAGRLFRSIYKNVERKNLMIFVSARLVKPDGTPFREQTNTSFFNFER